MGLFRNRRDPYSKSRTESGRYMGAHVRRVAPGTPHNFVQTNTRLTCLTCGKYREEHKKI